MKYDTRAAGEILNHSPSYVRDLIYQKKIKAQKDRFGQWQIDDSEVNRYLKERQKKSNKPKPKPSNKTKKESRPILEMLLYTLFAISSKIKIKEEKQWPKARKL
ncbi:MAG: hypothetical protein PWR10_1561 [Halanaerobiales bacterium]|nr:hypothetical protein [Halanaerobiales bacterium]